MDELSSFELRHGDMSSGRGRPLRLSLSRTVSRSVLAELGSRYIRKCPLPPHGTVCFMAIASSGFTLASCLGQAAATTIDPRRIYQSGIDPHRPLRFAESWLHPLRDMHVIVVDNSIETGKTASLALELLQHEDVRPVSFVKLLDYQDDLERQTNAYLEERWSIDFVSLYTFTEVLTQFDTRSIEQT